MNSEANPPSHRWPAIACTFGLMHAVVDATSVSVLVWGVRTTGDAGGPLPYDVLWSRYLLYNVLAFGTQFAIGAIADRWRAYRGTLLAGLAMIAVAVGLELLSPQAANMLAALGNAAFHVGAGAVVLSTSGKKTAPAGVFVGPGAVGLAFGFWSAQSNLGPWIFLGPLAVCAALAVALGNVAQQGRAAPRPPLSLSTAVAVACVGAILLAVAIRTASGFEVGAVHEGETVVLWGLAIAACTGNILGGLAADRWGWLATCVVVLLLSLPILGFFVDQPAVAILGMLLFQMTMPVTLTAVWRVFPGEAGLAFGLTALAVLVGAIPFYVFPAEWVATRALLVSLGLVSIAAVVVGLLPIVRGERTHHAPP